jgi:hypothetical protein
MTKEDMLLKTLTRIEKKFGDLHDTSLARMYEEGLDALRTNDDHRKWMAAEGLIEWEKHHLYGA